MNQQVTIRSLKRSDIEPLHQLLMQVFTDLSGKYYPTTVVRQFKKLHTIHDLERRVLGPRAIAVGAFAEGKLVGFLWGTSSSAGDFYGEWGGVHTSLRRAGVFSRLLKRTEREVRARRLYKFWFHVSATNLPAINCYIKAKYTLEGVHPNHFFGWGFLSFGKVIRYRRWHGGVAKRPDITSLGWVPPQLRTSSLQD